MKIPYTDLQAQYQFCKTEVDEAIKYVIDTNQFITGPIVDEFENDFSVYTGAESCASVGSGSMALILALKALGIGKGQEVITTPMTFVATPEAICNVGASPVFVDVDENYLIDVNKIEEAITDKTSAILFVDLYGQSPNLDRLNDIAKKHRLFIIEDAAQSAGASFGNKIIGHHDNADLTCFSFNPVKNFGAMGDAGGVTGTKQLIDKVKLYRDHGRSERYSYDTVGYNSRIDCMQAKILTAKLPALDEMIQKKRDICHRYNDQLKNVVTPEETRGAIHSYYAYVIRHEDRDGLQKHLQDNGIQTNIHYKGTCHTQPAYSNYKSNCPVAEEYTKQILSIPSYFTLTEEQQGYIVEKINEY